jgi:AcrR family transcriptional regulator
MIETKPAPGRRERKREQTKQVLVQAAFNLFIKKGYDETTIDDIVDAADMAKVTFYYYFHSKEEIILEMKRHTAAETLGRAKSQLEEDQPSAKVLDTFVCDLTAWTEENWRILEVFAAQRFTRNKDLCQSEEESPLVSFLKDLVVHGQRRGEYRKELTPLQVAHFITMGIMNEHFTWMRLGRQPGTLKPNINSCLDFLMNGITDRSKTKK